MSKDKIITLDEYNNNKNKTKKEFYYLSAIKNTIKHNNLQSLCPKKPKKKELESLLTTYFENLNNYTPYLEKIVLLQNSFKKY